MKIFCKELNQEFDSKTEMFKELVKNESKIVDLKKATIKESDSVSTFFALKESAYKGLDFVKEGFYYPVINTTNFLDSHDDVHFPNIWNRSLKDKANKIFYVLEHRLSIDNVIAFPNDVNAFVKTVSWNDLGFNYPGETQALIYEIGKDKIKIPKIKELLEEKTAFENSVRMRYITIKLAINTKDPDMVKYKTLWDERAPLVVNIDKNEEDGYFWAIDEASIEKEGSLCLFGSNSATPIIYGAGESTSNKFELEPSNDTQPRRKTFIN